MSRRLLISWLPGETRAALDQDGRLERLLVLRRDHPRRFGNAYLGRVTGRHAGLGALLVDIGAERDALLPVERLTAPLSEGARAIVEVVREAPAGKGVRVRLAERDEALEEQARGLKAPALLRRGADPLGELLVGAAPPDEVVIDQATALSELKRRFGADALALARLAPAGARLFEQEGLEAAIDALLVPPIDLPSGGSLLIEPVQSMVPIDVNSGRAREEGGAAGRALATDLEAADEIPRQLRLRALCGLIVVDFLELSDPGQRKALAARLRRGLEPDPAQVRIAPMRASGLVELTRQRIEPALHEILTEPCGLGGAGRRKSAVTLGYEALRGALAAAPSHPGRVLSLALAPEVASALEGSLAQARDYVEARLGRPLPLVATESLTAPAHEVVVGSPS